MAEYILALSTSSGVAQVSLSEQGGNICFDFEIADYQQQSATLLPQLGDLMAAHQIRKDQIKAVAVNLGPGGFTSLRTACGVAQGLSVAWGVPCIPISSFEILLFQAQAQGHKLAGEGAVLIDARLGEFYTACFDLQAPSSSGGRQFLLAASTDAAQPVLAKMDWVVADQSCLPIIAEWGWLNRVESRITTSATAKLAWDKHCAGVLTEALACQPLYIREKVADTTAERLAKRNGTV